MMEENKAPKLPFPLAFFFFSPSETTFRPSFLPPMSCLTTFCFYDPFGLCIRMVFYESVSLSSLQAS